MATARGRRAVTGVCRRHQVTELPPIEAHITEFQCPEVVCPACGKTTQAPVPDEVKRQCGAQLTALIAYLTVVCRLPRRVVQRLLEGALHIPISLGSTHAAWEEASDAVAAPCQALEDAIEGDYVDTSERRGSDIDARTRRTRPAFRAGADVLVGSGLVLALGVEQQETNWQPGETFRGVELRQQLDQTAETANMALRWKLTPFTTFVLHSELQQDRFTFSPERDSDSYRVFPGFEFAADALLGGQVFIGYRAFQPRSQHIPGYRGVVSAVELSTVVLGRTRVGVLFDRRRRLLVRADRAVLRRELGSG